MILFVHPVKGQTHCHTLVAYCMIFSTGTNGYDGGVQGGVCVTPLDEEI